MQGPHAPHSLSHTRQTAVQTRSREAPRSGSQEDFGAGGRLAHWLMLVSEQASLRPHRQPVGHCWWGIHRRASSAPAKCWGCFHATPWSPTKKQLMEQKELTNHENMCLLFFKDTHSWVKHTKIAWNLFKAPAFVSQTHCTQMASPSQAQTSWWKHQQCIYEFHLSNILPFENFMLSKWEMASLMAREMNKGVCVGSLVCLEQHIRAERTC